MRIARLSGSVKNQVTLRDAMLLHDQLRTIEIPYDVAHDLRPRPQRVGGVDSTGFLVAKVAANLVPKAQYQRSKSRV